MGTNKRKAFHIGIYKITCIETGEFYIGQSKDLYKRKQSHFFDLRRRAHMSGELQNDYNKYKEKGFLFSVVVYCEIFDLDYYEQALIKNSHPLYNTVFTKNPKKYGKTDPIFGDANFIVGLEAKFKPLEWHRWVYGDHKRI